VDRFSLRVDCAWADNFALALLVRRDLLSSPRVVRPGWLVQPATLELADSRRKALRLDGKTKKADVAEHPKVFHHVGLLIDEPPGPAGLPFIQSSEIVCVIVSRAGWKATKIRSLAFHYGGYIELVNAALERHGHPFYWAGLTLSGF